MLKQHKRLDELSSGQRDTIEMIASGLTSIAIIAENYLEFLDNTVVFVDPEMSHEARLADPNLKGSALEEKPLLGNNIPNPFNNTTMIDYYLPRESEGIIVISDVFGKQIELFKVKSNSNEVLFRKGDLSSGIYFYKLVVDGKPIATKKMIIF